MAARREIEEILHAVCDFLNRERVPYVVVGGMAAMFHGLPRTTMDVDILLDLPEKKIGRLFSFLKERGFFASPDDFRVALAERSHCTVQDKHSMFRLDLKGIYTPADRETLERRVVFRHGDVGIRLSAPEDLIAHKLLFGSEQDLRDAEAVYARQKGRLDMDYLRGKCRRLGVSAEFRRMKEKVDRLTREEGARWRKGPR